METTMKFINAGKPVTMTRNQMVVNGISDKQIELIEKGSRKKGTVCINEHNSTVLKHASTPVSAGRSTPQVLRPINQRTKRIEKQDFILANDKTYTMQVLYTTSNSDLDKIITNIKTNAMTKKTKKKATKIVVDEAANAEARAEMAAEGVTTETDREMSADFLASGSGDLSSAIAESQGKTEETAPEENAPEITPEAPKKTRTPKPPKEPKEKKPRVPRQGGIISTIVELVTNATEPGISTAQIIDALCDKFPNSTRIQLTRTISARLPNGLNRERNLGIVYNKIEKENFYYIPKQ